MNKKNLLYISLFFVASANATQNYENCEKARILLQQCWDKNNNSGNYCDYQLKKWGEQFQKLYNDLEADVKKNNTDTTMDVNKDEDGQNIQERILYRIGRHAIESTKLPTAEGMKDTIKIMEEQHTEYFVGPDKELYNKAKKEVEKAINKMKQ